MPGAPAPCRTGWPCSRRCGSRPSRPYGEADQERPDPLGQPRPFALQTLETDVEPAASARELPAEPGGVPDLAGCRAEAERQLPAAHAQTNGRTQRAELGPNGPIECVVRVGIRGAGPSPVAPHDRPRKRRLGSRTPLQAGAIGPRQIIFGDLAATDVGPES